MANQLIINSAKVKAHINRMIYGQFAEHLGNCIYGGVYVGEDSSIPNVRGIRSDVVDALRHIKVPVIRWPGGCFADEYHWQNGIGPKKDRPSMINTHWGGVVENNHFGTHEFFDLCAQIGAEPYICGNVGSGTVREMSEWVEYMNSDALSPMTKLRAQNGHPDPFRLKYFGIGNENWNCGGRMRIEYYTDEMMRYNLYARDYGENKLYRIAAGPRNDNYKWTQHLMKYAAPFINAIGLHYYTRVGDKIETIRLSDYNEQYISHPENSRFSATEFNEDEWFGIMKAAWKQEELINKHTAIMDFYDPEHHVDLIIDEWGTWFNEEPGTPAGFLYQQNTMRDAISAATSLNIFNNHADRIHMTNIAQMVNVLQSMVLTKEDAMILTPTYHIFDMYKVHQDAELLDSALLCEDYAGLKETIPQLNASVSRNPINANVQITLANIDPNKSASLTVHIPDFAPFTVAAATILQTQYMNDHNTFENPDKVKPELFKDFIVEKDQLRLNVPARSVLLIVLKNGG